MTPLPPVFLDRPIAHRALHGAGRPENSRAAIRAAVDAGYGIEIDVQRSKDDQAMVFHDYALGRLTGSNGPIQQRDAADLAQLTLIGGDEGVPTLAEVLETVGGAVPVLVELKDQDGRMGPNIGPLEQAVAGAVAGYGGPVAFMSFNPHSAAEMARLCPDRPRGLTTCASTADDYPTVPAEIRDHLRTMPGLAEMGASFISHDHHDLDSPHVATQKARGLHVLCWTIRSPAEEAKARRIAENVTFEGYTA
ncbi:glycerophosphodiester phosphodiesterase family protein [Antarctobacter heliothermus]|uniref:Glycerophosphoryl diester phosphodiesterase n=1 Tax=Antarctobacter heliothermus TaxID=74033 RepID=A0A239I5T5_9RHOB|nr:glycerophosphodiester phosphodiesterase family protein [Antarctobacter heliothermus]SNS88443.1 Glycerophosphoryl diester phosphodiesterase [Antarctobacter heliothermus]